MNTKMPARWLPAAVLSSTSLAALAALAGTVFSSANYNASAQFANVLGSSSITVALDGSSYWSASGGNTGGKLDAPVKVLGSRR